MILYEKIRYYYSKFCLLFHVVAWLLYIFAPMILISAQNADFNVKNQGTIGKYLLILKLSNDALIIAFFYFNYYFLTPRVLKSKRVLHLFLAILFAALIILCFNSLFYKQIIEPQGFGFKLPNPIQRSKIGFPLPYSLSSILSLLFLTSMGTAWVLFKERVKEKEEKQKAILEKTAAELEALKLQISPHFLYNTLNSIRWLARKKSDDTDKAIINLSEILRYTIHLSSEKKVKIKQEIDYINSYLALQRNRFSRTNAIVFEIEIDNEETLIEPLLFINFLENCFNYGIDQEIESTIEIKLRLKEKQLFFSTKNKNFKHDFNSSSGIGNPNIKKRLQINYPLKHKLEISYLEDYYIVELNIDLSQDEN
jgi:sensor histidine kinase YesM